MNDSVESADVAIIGAGPIGLELAVCLKRDGVNYIQFDAHQIGYTISWWPRNTYFFSTTERIEIAGIPIQNLTQGRTTGEEYLAYLRSVVEQFDLQIHTYEAVMDIQRQEEGFILHTRTQAGDKVYSALRVVIAFGDMHFPNCLGIPGEDLPHVSHYFDDPHKYFRKRLLIVGGRNSAVEAALRCWRAGSIVSISYRRRSFDDKIVKNHILPDLLTQIELGNIEFLPETQPVSISPENVTLESMDGQRWEHPADFVLLNTGFVADPGLFKIARVHLIGEQCAPQFNPDTMETNVPGLYVAGTAAAGTQKRYRLFIENCHVHVGRIVAALTGSWPEQLGTISARQYDLPLEDIRAN